MQIMQMYVHQNRVVNIFFVFLFFLLMVSIVPVVASAQSQQDLDSAPPSSQPNASGSVVGQNSSGQDVHQDSGGNLHTDGDNGNSNSGGGGGNNNGGGGPSYSQSTVSCTSATNACGQSQTGTQTKYYTNGNLTSTSACSAHTPPLESYVGTSCQQTFNNICGYVDTAYGVKDCSNNCAVTYWPPVRLTRVCEPKPPEPLVCQTGFTGTPPNCTRSVCPVGMTGTPPSCTYSGSACPAGMIGTPPDCNVEVGVATIEIKAKPTLVARGSESTITWDGINVTGCRVSSDRNTDFWYGMNGRQLTSPLITRTVYTLTCNTLPSLSLHSSVKKSNLANLVTKVVSFVKLYSMISIAPSIASAGGGGSSSVSNVSGSTPTGTNSGSFFGTNSGNTPVSSTNSSTPTGTNSGGLVGYLVNLFGTNSGSTPTGTNSSFFQTTNNLGNMNAQANISRKIIATTTVYIVPTWQEF